MNARHYFNDNDPAACAWLRQLIEDGELPAGDVDERSILDVRAADLVGYTACHFFAGVGGWAYALRLAGWPDDRPVWTGSPPCQPFSVAGKGAGRDDARHLAPAFLGLVRACRPDVLFGEQVASAAVFGPASGSAGKRAARAPEWAWVDALFDGLEAAGYACGSADLPAAGIGAPHIRQRCFFGAVRVADRDDAGLEGQGQPGRECAVELPVGASGVVGRLADADGGDAGAEWQQRGGQHGQQSGDGGAGRVANPVGATLWGHAGEPRGEAVAGGGETRTPHGDTATSPSRPRRPGPTDGFWRDADWLLCRDGRWRPAQPAVLGLVDGLPGCVVPDSPLVPAAFPLAPKDAAARRVMRLRGYGNAIVPQLAAEFVAAFVEAAA